MDPREKTLQSIQNWMQELFEIDPTRVTPETHLYEDLDIDSIDAIDLVVKIREITGKQVKPEDFKNARLVSDVIDIIIALQ